MELVCYRDTELHRESRLLPAITYNQAQLLLSHNKDGVVFVPIRSMQYLAVIDDEEIIFLDSLHKEQVEIAWQNFRPQHRTALNQPVSYDAIYYHTKASDTMLRLQHEFPLALQALTQKDAPSEPARVIQLTSRDT